METPTKAVAGAQNSIPVEGAAKQVFQIRVYLIILAISLNVLSMAMVSAMISTTLGQPSFLAYFGFLQLTTANTPLIGATLGVYFAASFFGSILSGPLADKYGRKKTVMLGAIICALGTILVGGSVHIAMFLVFRFVTGLGSGISIAVSSLLKSELAPPQFRGLMVGLTGVMISTGYMIANWVGVGFYFVKAGGVQWRIPFILCAVPGLLVLCLLPVIPESPRWLCMQGRDQEAHDILLKLHGRGNVESREFAKLEIAQMSQQIAFERTIALPWWGIFQRKYWRRLALGCTTMIMSQVSGVVVIASYGPTIYKSLGFDTVAQLCMTAGYTTEAVVAALVGTLFIDRIGRKKMLIAGTAGQLCSISIVTALIARYAGSTNTTAQAVTVAFFFIFQTFYCFFVEGSGFAYIAEIWPVQLRSQGVGIAVSCIYVVNVPLLEASLYAWTTIGWKFYLVFISTAAFFLTVFTLLAKETRNLSLEEIGQLFGDPIQVPQLETMVHEHDMSRSNKLDSNSNEVFTQYAERVEGGKTLAG